MPTAAAEATGRAVERGVEVFCRCGRKLGTWKADGSFVSPWFIARPLPGGTLRLVVVRCAECRVSAAYAAPGHEARACPRCGEPVAGRPNKRYCSRRCQNLGHAAEWRGRTGLG